MNEPTPDEVGRNRVPGLHGLSHRHIEIEYRDAGIVVAWLNRPNCLNAVNDVLHRELAELFRAFDTDPAARVMVISGRGRGFCVGGDLTMMKQGSSSAEEMFAMLADGRRLINAMLETRKPVVAAVNGIAMGIGCQLALLADFAIAGHSARFSDGHMLAGIAAGDGGALIWPLLVGMAKAKRYLMTADTVDADSAAEMGLVLEAVDDDLLMATAVQWAERLADAPIEAAGLTKLVLNQWLRLGQLVGLDYGLAGESLGFLTKDAKERITFLQARHS